MSFTFKKLLAISIIFLIFIVLFVSMGAHILARKYIQTDRQNFIEMTFASIEAGPLALARLHASDYAQTYLDRIVSQLNSDANIIQKVIIYTKGVDTFEYAEYASKEHFNPRCIQNFDKSFTFPDAISTYHISLDINICGDSESISALLKTVYITLFLISFVVFIGFIIIMYPVIISIRVGSSLIHAKDVNDTEGLLNSIPFTPVRSMTLSALKSKKLERELAKIEVAKQVAHDIKSPLTALRAALEMIDLNFEKSKSLALSALARVSAIINDLNVEEKNKTIPAKNIIETLKDSIHLKQIEYPHIKFEFIVDSQITSGHLDAEVLFRCVSNIINNSVEALSKNIIIHVKNEDGPHVTIIDDGIGMSQEILSKVGQRGFTQDKPNGKGYGLSYVKEQIEIRGGSLEIQSQLNKGSQITIFFKKD